MPQSHTLVPAGPSLTGRRMAPFEPCTLKMGQDGDEKVFLSKVTGTGYNDMISLPTLTKDSILENLKRRFKVRGRAAVRRDAGGRSGMRAHFLARPLAHTPAYARARTRY